MLLPDFSVGCRRLTPGDPFMTVAQQPNVAPHKGAVSKVTPTIVLSRNAERVDVDTITCATEFNVSYLPRYQMRGRDGVLLQTGGQRYRKATWVLAYRTCATTTASKCRQFQSYNGFVLETLQAVGAKIVQLVQKIQGDHTDSFVSKQDVTDASCHHAQTWLVGTAWLERTCRSWENDIKTARVNTVWPGSSLHYAEMSAHPRYGNYKIPYLSPHNMFALMGWALPTSKSPRTVTSRLTSPRKKSSTLVTDVEAEARVRERKNNANHFSGHVAQSVEQKVVSGVHSYYTAFPCSRKHGDVHFTSGWV